MSDWTVIQGDCRQVLAKLPETSVHCCVTRLDYSVNAGYNRAGGSICQRESYRRTTP